MAFLDDEREAIFAMRHAIHASSDVSTGVLAIGARSAASLAPPLASGHVSLKSANCMRGSDYTRERDMPDD